MAIKESVRNYVLENFLFTDDESLLADSESFLKKGIIDSTGILELIMFVEAEFEMRVSEADMTIENFDSVNQISRFVESRTGTAEQVSASQ